MYGLSDTISAVSSPTTDGKVIVRLSGPAAIEEASRIFEPSFPKTQAGITKGFVCIDDELKIEARLYLFLAGHSYTAEDVVEIHIFTNSSVTQAVVYRLMAGDVRMAGPGEFTARGYLNGRMDLAQAEAVNEIIVSSNRIQLAAAQRLLSGRLGQALHRIRSQLFDCLSLIEAGLDFSDQTIEFISRDDAVGRLSQIKKELQQLLDASVSYEAVIDLPSVGVAGAPNAGKSLLVNMLLGKKRSIVSRQRKTTRDILTSQLSLEQNRCVLFDCAGLTRGLAARRVSEAENIIDELSQQAAIEALEHSDVVVFCVDLSKPKEKLADDISIIKLVSQKNLLAVATKSDLLEPSLLGNRIKELCREFGLDFIATSAKTGFGIDRLKKSIDKKLTGSAVAAGRGGVEADTKSWVGLTSRHRQSVTEAIESLSQAIDALKEAGDEVAAMLLRSAYQSISDIEQQDIDEQILENIFSRFCIGK